MRKKGGRGFPKGGGSFVNEHDDRTNAGGSQEITRRVSFKTGRRNKPNRQRGWDQKLSRVLVNTEDIEMVAIRGSSHNAYQKKKARLKHRDGPKKRTIPESPSYWYKVTIRHGNKYEKDFLLKLLANFIKPHSFIPYGFKVTKDDSSFIIDDHKAAEELANADRRITVPDGWKLSVNVRSLTPFIEIDDKLTLLIKNVMSTRYDLYTKTLNVSKFHDDPTLLSEGIFCPLNRPNVIIAVLGLIGDLIPDLVSLDISENKINATEHLKIMVDKVPCLKCLNIGNNKLRDIKLLDSLKGLPLEEIILDGNSLCDKFTDREIYIRAVRQRFPKIIKLDRVELPPPILFDIEDEGKLPSSQASFMCDPNGSGLVREFLQQYYQIYDSNSRQALIQAYHEQAQFSMDIFTPPAESHSLGVYLPDSRNLLKVCHTDKRIRLLRKGQNQVTDFLKSLPSTQHDPGSFTVDLVLCTPEIIQVCVCGVFRETSKKVFTRSFSRVFLIVPVGSGFCIINEQLTILQANQEQIKKAFKVRDTPSSSPTPPLVVEPHQVQNEAVATIQAKQQMVTELSLKTGMNLVWSERCLVETNWVFERALFAFTEIQKQGTLPAEAFVK